MNFISFGYLFSSFFCLVMAAFVMGRHEKSLTRDAFLVQVVSGFVWQFGSFLVLTSQNSESATFFSRIAYIGCVFLSVASYHLVVNFLDLAVQRKFVKFGYYFGAIVFIPLLMTDLLIDQAYHYTWGYWFKAGNVHPLFLVFLSFYGLMTLINLLMRLSKTQDRIAKNKCRFLLWTYVICYFSIVDFLPDYGFDVLPFGFLFVNLWLFVVWFIIKFYDFFQCGEKSFNGTRTFNAARY